METLSPFRNARIVSINTDPDAYHRSSGVRGEKDFIMSRSELSSFSVCPSRWCRGYKEKESTTSTDWGSLIDTLLLSPDAFEDRIAVYPESYPSEFKKGEWIDKPWSNNSNFAKEWKKAKGEKLFIKDDENNEAHIALAALRSDADIAAICDRSQRQVFVMAEYEDRDTGLIIPVKALIDIVPTLANFEKSLIDFKTCASAAMRPWTQSVYNFGYHVQGSMYLDLFNACTHSEDRRETFMHIIQESVSPWQTAKRFLSSEFIDLGRITYLQALRRYCRCLKDGQWPGYDDDTADLVVNGFRVVNLLPWMINAQNEDAFGSWQGHNVPDEPEAKPTTTNDTR